MGRNYYEVLGVAKGTSDEAAIKKAYKKSALKFHPDRPGGDKVKFQEVSEAFEVLSDPKKKKLYDQFGEAGLGAGGAASDDESNGQPGRGGGGGGTGVPFGTGGQQGTQTFSFRTTGGGGGGGRSGGAGSHGFHGSDPFSVFQSFFGTMDVDQAMGGGGAGGGGFSSFPMGGMSEMRMGGSPTGAGGMGGMSSMSGMQSGVPASRSSRQAPPVEHPLNLSLEELYKGSSKRMRITKKTASGETQVDKTITIKPGWKDGTRITFAKEGDEQPGMVPADIIFVIQTKPHPRFSREGHNLICTLVITLEQALAGFEIPVDTLDARKVIVREPGIASSLHETIIKGEGMPSQKDQRVRGDLTVRYSVEFPPPAKTEADKMRRRQAVAGL